ncbi:MAG: nickel transporter, partial [Rubrobacter sp.]
MIPRVVWLLPLCVLALALLVVALPREAEAHPLGNFTINHYSRIEFSDEEARVIYVLDLAEIPTFQQRERLDTDGDGTLSDAEAAAYLDTELPSLLDGLGLTVGGERLPLRMLDRSASYRPGQGGLPTLRIETSLLADLPSDWREDGAGRYAVTNYEERLGWREIVLRDGPGIVVEDSTAPAKDVSSELRSYPRDMLFSPLDRREATFTIAPGNGSATGDTADRAAERVEANRPEGAIDRVTSLISADRLSPALIILSMLAALFWGAAHALTPGHGKAVVAAYLIGSRGTARDAGILGLTVTLTHTVGVFALGAITLYLSRYVLPEVLYPWLNVASGMLVVVIG